MAKVSYLANVPPLPSWAEGWLKSALDRCGVVACIVTETVRTPARQAEIMYGQCASRGVDAQRALYGDAGRQVVQTYVDCKAKGLSADVTKAAMAQKIVAIGGSNVSHHIPTGSLAVFDVAPSSIPASQQPRFIAEVKAQLADRTVVNFIPPPKDLAFHIEILPEGAARAAGRR